MAIPGAENYFRQRVFFALIVSPPFVLQIFAAAFCMDMAPLGVTTLPRFGARLDLKAVGSDILALDRPPDSLWDNQCFNTFIPQRTCKLDICVLWPIARIDQVKEVVAPISKPLMPCRSARRHQNAVTEQPLCFFDRALSYKSQVARQTARCG